MAKKDKSEFPVDNCGHIDISVNWESPTMTFIITKKRDRAIAI